MARNRALRHRLRNSLLPLLLAGTFVTTLQGSPLPEDRPQPLTRTGARADPGAAWDHLALAETAAEEGRGRDAVDAYRNAVRNDPDLLGAWIGLAGQGLRRDPQLFVEGFTGAVQAIGHSWEMQRRLAATLLPPLWTATTLAAVLLLAGIGLRHLPRKRHVLLEAFRPHVGRWPAGSVATLLCLAPLAVQWGLAAAAATYAGMVRENLGRRETRLGLAAIVWIVLSPGIWKITAPWVAPLDPQGVSRLVERTQREAPSPELERTLREAAAGSSAPALAFAEGMLLRRSGRLEGAAGAFERAAGGGRPIGQLARVNLGNLRLWNGDPTGAAQEYEQVLDEPSARLEARYNLAIALSRLYRFEEADERLEEATRLDFERVRSAVRAGASRADTGVMDGMLTPVELWLLDRSARTATMPIPPLLVWFFPGGRLAAAPAALLGGLLSGLLIGRLLRRRLRVYECQHCGTAVCRRCVVRRAGHAHCSSCAKTIGSLPRAAYNRAVLRRLLDRETQGPTRKRRIAANLLPGIGLILRGRPTAGLVGLWFFAFGVVLATRAAWAFPSSPALGGLEDLLRLSGIGIAVFTWIASIDIARHTRSTVGVRRYFEKDVYRAAA